MRDFSAADGPYLTRVRQPASGPPFVAEPVISQFAGPADDDPIAVALVPPGFQSGLAQPGDLLILDQGADGNDSNAI